MVRQESCSSIEEVFRNSGGNMVRQDSCSSVEDVFEKSGSNMVRQDSCSSVEDDFGKSGGNTVRQESTPIKVVIRKSGDDMNRTSIFLRQKPTINFFKLMEVRTILFGW